MHEIRACGACPLFYTCRTEYAKNNLQPAYLLLQGLGTRKYFYGLKSQGGLLFLWTLQAAPIIDFLRALLPCQSCWLLPGSMINALCLFMVLINLVLNMKLGWFNN